MNPIKITLFFFLLVHQIAAETILIYHTSIPVMSSESMDPSKGPIARNCYYFIASARASEIPSASPLKEESILHPTRAISVAYRKYFEEHDIEAKDYLDMVEVTLKKVDDYTLSFVADHLRKQPNAVRNIWFYQIECGWPKSRKFQEELPPILVLMDESVVLPKVVTKGLFEPQPDFVPK